MGTWALSPRSMTKLACMELRGPMMACTSTFFIKSRAVFEKEKKYNLMHIQTLTNEEL
jgi:hypothetical protein